MRLKGKGADPLGGAGLVSQAQGACSSFASLLGLLGGLGDLSGTSAFLLHALDDPNSHSLPHVPYGKTP